MAVSSIFSLTRTSRRSNPTSLRFLSVLCIISVSSSMSTIPSGSLVILQELNSSSPHFKQGASLRVTGKLQEYNAETAIAVIADGGATLAIDTQHLRLNLRVGSLYQFIGELSIQPTNEGILKARVGRNVDGMDLNLYQQSLKLLRQFQSDHNIHLEHLQ